MMFGAITLIGMTLCAAEAEKRTYPCHRLAQAPALDGKMDDEAWKNIPEATGFYIFPGSGKYALEKQTSFKAGWTDDAIYLAVRAEESAPEKLIVKAKGNDNVWSEDNIELLFVPTGASNYTQLVASSAGSRWNARENQQSVGELDVLDSMTWEVKAVVGKTEWFLELRIPFAVLMTPAPKEGDEWPVNVARNILTGPAGERLTCWPLLTKGFNETPNYGRFVFKGVAGDKALDEEKEMNRSYIQYVHGEIRKFSGKAEKYEKSLTEVKQQESQRKEAEDLLRICEQTGKLATQSDPDWRELRVVYCASLTMRQRCEDCIALGMMEKLFQD